MTDFTYMNDARKWAKRWREADKALRALEVRLATPTTTEQPFPWSFKHTAERLAYRCPWLVVCVRLPPRTRATPKHFTIITAPPCLCEGGRAGQP